MGALCFVPAGAGTVDLLADSPQADGKLALNPKTIQVAGTSSKEINLPDVLAARFADGDFHLDYFSSEHTPDQLPANWKAQDIGKNDAPGSFTYANGTFKLVSGSHVITDWSDGSERDFFVGVPWAGSGEWTIHIKDYDPQNPNATMGLVLREGFDKPTQGLFRIGVKGQNGGYIYLHYPNAGYYSQTPPLDIPVWLRISRNGTNLAVSSSSDGKAWGILNQTNVKFADNAWIGMMVDDGQPPVAKNTVDQVRFTPGPSLADILPSGLLLCSGTYLAGDLNQLDTTVANPTASFFRNGKEIAVPNADIGTVILFPTPRHQMASYASQAGLLLKNGDFVEGDILSVQAGDPSLVRVSSLTLGISEFGDRFGQSPTRAAFLKPMQLKSSDYEIRLTDGSIIRANGITMDSGQLIIAEVSGLNIPVSPDEIAQFRAGPAHVQNLLDLPWKTPASVSAAKADPIAAATPKPGATNAAPLVVVPASTGEIPPVENWEGNQQEQMLVVASRTPVDFPLSGKFEALAMRIALSPESSADAQATVRVLAGGKEIFRSPPVKADELPRFVRIPLKDPQSVTLVVDSISAGARMLFIDPVAIRSSSP